MRIWAERAEVAEGKSLISSLSLTLLEVTLIATLMVAIADAGFTEIPQVKMTMPSTRQYLITLSILTAIQFAKRFTVSVVAYQVQRFITQLSLRSMKLNAPPQPVKERHHDRGLHPLYIALAVQMAQNIILLRTRNTLRLREKMVMKCWSLSLQIVTKYTRRGGFSLSARGN